MEGNFHLQTKKSIRHYIRNIGWIYNLKTCKSIFFSWLKCLWLVSSEMPVFVDIVFHNNCSSMVLLQESYYA